MKTKCLIVDDEPLARELIRGHVEKLENFEVVAECSDAMKALNVLREKQVDLIFMDIQMPQITGIEFLKTLKHPPKVIITTAYREFALEGFELDVVDYLMEEKLPGESFLRIHKSFIVSLTKIEAFTANTIEIQGKELPIGRSFKNGVLSALNFSGTVAGV